MLAHLEFLCKRRQKHVPSLSGLPLEDAQKAERRSAQIAVVFAAFVPKHQLSRAEEVIWVSTLRIKASCVDSLGSQKSITTFALLSSSKFLITQQAKIKQEGSQMKRQNKLNESPMHYLQKLQR